MSDNLDPMQRLIQKGGFSSEQEYITLITSVDLYSKPATYAAFKKWTGEDGTKAGLMRLIGASVMPADSSEYDFRALGYDDSREFMWLVNQLQDIDSPALAQSLREWLQTGAGKEDLIGILRLGLKVFRDEYQAIVATSERAALEYVSVFQTGEPIEEMDGMSEIPAYQEITINYDWVHANLTAPIRKTARAWAEENGPGFLYADENA